jgi:putative transposase
MPTKNHTLSSRIDELEGRDRVKRSEPVGRAELDAIARGADEGPGPPELPQEVVEQALAQERARRAAAGAVPESVRGRLPDALIDELLEGRSGQAEVVGKDGLLGELTKRLLERAMAGELTAHLGYEPHHEPPGGTGNARNGTTPKTVQTRNGPVEIDRPRDRNGSYKPQIVENGRRRFDGFDEQIVALYSRGMTTRDIECHLTEIYGTSVSRQTISTVTAAVLDDAREWQQRPLSAVYPIVYLDAMIVKIRENKTVQNTACYLAVGVDLEGHREVLGMWFAQAEGAKFWLGVLTELKGRGVEDVLVCCVDGLTGFPEAIEAVYPRAWVQTCIVHQIRSSTRFVGYRERKAVAADLKKIYTATDRDEAEHELTAFAEKWDDRYPMISASWIENWERIVPFLAFPEHLRRIVYTTNTIEALNRQIRKHVKTRGSFPTQDSARKLLYLTIKNAEHNWRPAYNWSAALAALKIFFGDRLPD